MSVSLMVKVPKEYAGYVTHHEKDDSAPVLSLSNQGRAEKGISASWDHL